MGTVTQKHCKQNGGTLNVISQQNQHINYSHNIYITVILSPFIHHIEISDAIVCECVEITSLQFQQEIYPRTMSDDETNVCAVLYGKMDLRIVSNIHNQST